MMRSLIREAGAHTHTHTHPDTKNMDAMVCSPLPAALPLAHCSPVAYILLPSLNTNLCEMCKKLYSLMQHKDHFTQFTLPVSLTLFVFKLFSKSYNHNHILKSPLCKIEGDLLG